MLSYLHAFHAGNFADVIKHVVLLDVLDYLCQKSKPIRYIDTHAGAGLYPLGQKHMQQLKEYQQGILKLWPASPKSTTDVPAPIARYLEAIRQWNSSPKLKQYPGSPALAYQQLRAQDQLHLAELHGSTFRQLNKQIKENFQLKASPRSENTEERDNDSTTRTTPLKTNKPKVLTFQTDGFKHVSACLPPQKGRACVLIDPAYEVKSDYKTVVNAVVEGHKRCHTGTFLVWYPIIQRPQVQQMKQQFRQAGLPNTDCLEFRVRKDSSTPGMSGSGLILVNAPWNLKSRLKPALDFLKTALAEDKPASWHMEQLVGESGKPTR